MKAAHSPSLGFWRASALVAGNMIGSGVFLLPASLALYGGYSLLGWLVSATGALVLALVFAALGREMPRLGGPYAFTREVFGDLPAFLVAWGYWVSICAGNAAIAIAFGGYLGFFLPAISETPFLAAGVALAAVWLLTWVNARGVREAGLVQISTTALKLLPLLVIALVGLPRVDLRHFAFESSVAATPGEAVLGAAALTLWAFLGLESATIPAADVIRPRITIPRATLAGTLLAAGLYVSSTTAVMGLVAPAELARSSAPFGDAARALWGNTASGVVAAGAAIACFGALNGWILLQGQMPLAAARDGLFPRPFARLSGRGTPVFALLTSGVLVTVIVAVNFSRGLVGAFTFVILLSTLTCLLPYVFSCLARWRLLHRSPERKPGAMGLAAVGLLFSLAAVVGTGAEAIAWGALLLLAGLPVYRYARRDRLSPP